MFYAEFNANKLYLRDWVRMNAVVQIEQLMMNNYKICCCSKVHETLHVVMKKSSVDVLDESLSRPSSKTWRREKAKNHYERKNIEKGQSRPLHVRQ